MVMKATTILAVQKNGKIAIGGDGQVTLGNTVMKDTAKKIRKIYNGKVVCGFAGSVSDAITLSDMFEKSLNKTQGDILRAAVDVTQAWRGDKFLRKLESMMIVCNEKKMILISGSGEIIEPENNVLAIGSGGDYARSAALALKENTDLHPFDVVEKSLNIAAKICIYTNSNITIETFEG